MEAKSNFHNNCEETIDYLRKNGLRPEIVVILGSGLGAMEENIVPHITIPYSDIPHFIEPSVETHQGKLLFKQIAAKDVIFLSGRTHVYEGKDVLYTIYPVYIAGLLGAKIFITTNLVGGIRDDLEIGDFVIIEDHINLSGQNPLIPLGAVLKKPLFVDMYDAYSPRLIRLFESAALSLKLEVKKGILAYLSGPNFETRAELKVLNSMGADIVGWSMVPEILVARSQGMEALGISCISDLSKPASLEPVNIDKIFEVGVSRAETLYKALVKFIRTL